MRVTLVGPCMKVRVSAVFSIPVWRYPITGLHRLIISPSNSSCRRSTPWVEGCWGPMLMIIRSSSETSSSYR